MSGRFAAAALCAALPCLPAFAQDHPVKPAPHSAPVAQDGSQQDKPVFVVAQVGTDFQVVAKSEVDNLKKQLAEKHKQAMAEYAKEKAAADAAHKKFERAAPKEATVVVKPGEYPTKDAADAAMQKLIAAQKGDKPKPPVKPPVKPHGGGH
jgi:hypothetical protein